MINIDDVYDALAIVVRNHPSKIEEDTVIACFNAIVELIEREQCNLIGCERPSRLEDEFCSSFHRDFAEMPEPERYQTQWC